MGNGGFHDRLSEPQGVSAWWKETAKRNCIRSFSFLDGTKTQVKTKEKTLLPQHHL